MSQYNEGPKAFTAGEALEAYRRVKLSSGSGTQVEYADAGEEFIGITAAKVASGEQVTVIPRSAARTYKVTAKEALSVGATLYGGDDGKVQDSASGTAQGTALEAATADGDIIEALLDNGAAGEIDGGSVAVEAEDGNGGIPILFKKTGIADATTAVAIVTLLPFKCLMIDWWLISRDTDAANVKLQNGDDEDISANVAKGTANDAIVRGGTIVAGKDELAAGSKLQVLASAAEAFDIFVLVEKIS